MPSTVVLTGVQAVAVFAGVLYGYATLPFYLYPALLALLAEAVTQVAEALPAQDGAKGRFTPLSAQDAEKRKVSFDELAQHNDASSAWLAVRGKVYDVTHWLEDHPGGKEHLLLMAGREVTDIFDSYHPFTNKAELMLPKLLVGTLSTAPKLPTYKADKSGFYADLRKRVGDHLRAKGLDDKAVWPGVWRMALVLAVAAACFSAMHTEGVPALVRVAAACVYGACQALPLLHIMHDCSHTAWGHTEIGWKWAGRLMMDWFAGASMTSWHNQHVVGHHVHTNVIGADPDLPVDFENDIRRLTPRQVWKAQYKYQYIYLLPLYGLLGLKFRIQDIMLTFIDRSNGPIPVNPISAAMWAKQVTSKVSFVAWRLFFPYFFFGASPLQILALFLLAEMCTGWYLALNFQVSHVSTAAVFPDSTDPADSLEWAKMQVATSVDYAHGDLLMTFLCGALNYQTVHHLFPSVSQYLYPEIAPVVVATCEKWNVKFNHLPTFTDAFTGHIDHLRNMGMKEGKSKKID